MKYGITNVAATDDTGTLGMLDPTRYVVYFDDFCSPTQDILAGASATAHTVTITQAGAGSASITKGTTNYGEVIILNDDADNDVVNIQLKGEGFLYSSSKDFLIKARFKVSDATNCDFFVGVAITDTSALDATDRIGFNKADDVATMTIATTKNSTTTTVNSSTITLANDTYLTAVIRYSARDKALYAYKDGVCVGTTTTLTNLPDDEALTPTIVIQNGAAAAKSMTVDYLLVAFER